MIETYRILAYLPESMRDGEIDIEYHAIRASLRLWGEAFDDFKDVHSLVKCIEEMNSRRESCIIVLDRINEELYTTLTNCAARYEVLFVTTETGAKETSDPKYLSVIKHFLSVQQGHLATTSLISALKKISTREIFGIEKYLTYGTPLHFFVLSRSEDRAWFVERLMDYIVSLDGVIISGAGEFARMAGEVLDEFLMNAIWDANPNRCRAERSIPVVLRPDESVRVEWGVDGKLLAVGVRDPFGTLQKQTLLAYIDEILGQKKNKSISVNCSGAGAGLGLHMVLRRVSGLIVNLAPSFGTEVVALLDLTRSPRYLQKGAKTFHFFSF